MATRMMVGHEMMQSPTQSAGQPAQAAPPPSPAQARAQFKQDLTQQIIDATTAATDAALAAQNGKIAGGPARIQGTLVPPIPPGYDSNNIIPPQAVDIAIGFFIMCAVMVVGWPLARAFGRRIERKSETPAVNPAMSQQLERIEQAVDAMSIEIERISESQRFLAKLQSGAPALPVERS